MSRFHLSFLDVQNVISDIYIGITYASQFGIATLESYVLLVSTFFLLFLTAAITVLYYRRIREVKARYEEARGVVGDVVVSFNKQLQRQGEMLEKASYRIEGLSAKSENVWAKVEELGKQTKDVASKVASSSEAQGLLLKDIEDVKAGLDSVKKTQDKLAKHVAETPEAKIEAAIPIKREHVLAPLTETELRVLEFIAEGGGKTAPEIRELTKMTREHSARLVKKLYEDGYLERNIEKTPYRYRVKDEMLKILKKSEAKA